MLTYLQTLLAYLRKNEEGQDLTEYAILIAVIALIVVVAAALFGTALSDWFAGLSQAIPLT